MEQRLANAWRMTLNEKIFIETALLSDLRIDGLRAFDSRRLTIKLGREDGSCEVQLGQMGFVTAQLAQPYREAPNEGTLSIYTEFSPMADPSFEAGRPGESAMELGHIVDYGLSTLVATKKENEPTSGGQPFELNDEDPPALSNPSPSSAELSEAGTPNRIKTLKDAVKPKNKKKMPSLTTNPS